MNAPNDHRSAPLLSKGALRAELQWWTPWLLATAFHVAAIASMAFVTWSRPAKQPIDVAAGRSPVVVRLTLPVRPAPDEPEPATEALEKPTQPETPPPPAETTKDEPAPTAPPPKPEPTVGAEPKRTKVEKSEPETAPSEPRSQPEQPESRPAPSPTPVARETPAKLTAPPQPRPVAPPQPAEATPPAAPGPSGENTKPKIVHLPKPVYPTLSDRLREEGVVEIEVQVLPDGSVGDVRVLKHPGHHRLVNAVIEAIKQARFEPAFENGEPVATRITLPPFRFRWVRGR